MTLRYLCVKLRYLYMKLYMKLKYETSIDMIRDYRDLACSQYRFAVTAFPKFQISYYVDTGYYICRRGWMSKPIDIKLYF